jgi:hypothetical protein
MMAEASRRSVCGTVKEEKIMAEGTPEIVPFIDSGHVTTPVNIGGNTLTDDTKNWGADICKNRLIKIISGSGEGQASIIVGNSDKTQVIKDRWVKALDTTSVYVILGENTVQSLRDVLGGGSDINAANPLETHDPKIEEVEDKLDHPDHGLAALKAAIGSLAGGAFYGSYGPRNVEVGNDVDFGTILYDPSGNIITVGEITPGNYTIRRVRGAIDTEIVGSTPSSEAAGRVYLTYAFPAVSWNVGDIFYITFSGITVTLDGVTTEYPALYTWGRVVREADISAKVEVIDTKIGTFTDGGAAATLFGRHKKLDTAVHAHLLLVVHDTSALDANLDTPLKTLLEEFGFEVEVADPADVAGNLELNFDGAIVSASCVVGDVGNLANLKTVACPVVCHSAAIAVSAVFNLGTTAGTEAAKTQIEIKDNTVQWFLDQVVGDLTVTAAATIYTIGTKGVNAITLAEEDTGTGNDITCLILLQGLEDDGDPAYAPDFDRVFFGLGDADKANDPAKDIYFHLYEHLLHEVRFSPETVVTPKRVYQEQIPDTDVSDTATAIEANCILLDIGPKQNRRFCLRHFRLKAQADPVLNTMTVRLYEYFHGVLTEMDSFDIDTTNWGTCHSLADMFALPEVHSDAIRITCKMSAATLDVKATYSCAEAKK